MNTAEKIKAYLDDHGIKQVFLSEKTGIPIAKLNQSLNGNRRISLLEYERICWALNVGADMFLEPRAPIQKDA